jgi:DNA-binding NtrC family response regulator
VDDELGICRFLEQTLTMEDYEVEVFDNPVKALEHLQGDPDYAVIISDYRMPEIHGIEFLSRSRDLAPKAVRMMLTAFGKTINFSEARKKVQLFNYLAKPIGPDELVFQVERAFEQYELVTDEKCSHDDEDEDDDD